MWYFTALLACSILGLASARSGYIVNGNNAGAPGAYPWQASFQDKPSGFHFCGASLISKRWLVTAAHCAQSKSPYYVQIGLGLYDKDTKRHGKPKTYDVSKLIVHSKFNKSTLKNDIALIKLTKDVDFNKMVNPINLPEQGQRFEGNKKCVITGWGQVSGGNAPDVLQSLRVEVKHPSWCDEKIRTIPWWGNTIPLTTEDQVCLRPLKERASACFGDSGGPLACNHRGKWVLVGDASFVISQCRTDMPNWYGNISFFRDWIKQVSGV